jgi:hypothetical protein
LRIGRVQKKGWETSCLLLVEVPDVSVGVLTNKIQPRERSRGGEYGWQKTIIYGPDNSLSVNWNADGLNVDHWYNCDNANYNLGALPRRSPPQLFLFKRPYPSTKHFACFLQYLLK